MSGTSEGSKKSAETNKLRHGIDFYKNIGAKSWNNPDRSHVTGFALLPEGEAAKLGALGGSKNKGKKYKKQVAEVQPISQNSSSVSE